MSEASLLPAGLRAWTKAGPGLAGVRRGSPLIFRDPVKTGQPGRSRRKHLRATWGGAPGRGDGRAEPRNGWRPAPCSRRGGGGGGGGGQRRPAGGARAINPPRGGGRAAVGARRRQQQRHGESGSTAGKGWSLRPSAYPTIHLTTCPSICLPIHLPTYPPVRPSSPAGLAAPLRVHPCITFPFFFFPNQ